MSLFDQLDTAAPPRGSRCRVMVVMDKLPAEEKAPFGAALARGKDDLPATEIARVLRENGYGITYASIQRHRRGDCQCGVSA